MVHSLLWLSLILSPPDTLPPAVDSVYLCTGPAAYAYHHYGDCEGLIRCHYRVDRYALTGALQEERQECGYCRYRQRKARSNK